MGQRHQIYLAYTDKDTKETKVEGLHHQWLFGATAIRSLKNCLTFFKNVDKDYAFSYELTGTIKAFESAFSVDFESGYASRVTNFRKVDELAPLSNPDSGDNNDGITIIDCRDLNNIKYCFMGLYDSCNIGGNRFIEQYDTVNRITESHKVNSANRYIQAYYGNNWPVNLSHNSEGEVVKGGKTYAKQVVKNINAINKFDLLTENEVKEIFPAMFKKQAVA